MRKDRTQAVQVEAASRVAALTLRERDVVRGIVLGRPTKMIAYHLNIASRTVDMHRASIIKKLGARCLSDILRLTLAAGFDSDAKITSHHIKA